MAARVERALDAQGVASPGALGLLEGALTHRWRAIRDDQHPDVLHPARAMLILLEDARCARPETLGAVCLFDSDRPELAPEDAGPPSPEEAPDVAAARLVAAAIPTPHRSGELLLESLVSSSDAELEAALAERLDHARHLHLRLPPTSWETFHESVVATYLPVADRRLPPLARRFRAWAAAFARHRLGHR